MASPFEALAAGLENLCAENLGKQAWLCRGAALTFNMQRIELANLPVNAEAITLVETAYNKANKWSGLLDGNPDTLVGEPPNLRAFVVRVSEVGTQLTVDDRLVMVATGQNFAVVGCDPEGELGESVFTYRVTCKAI